METILRPFKRMRFHEPTRFMKPTLKPSSKRKFICEELPTKKRNRFDFERITAALQIQKIWRAYKTRTIIRIRLYNFYTM